MKIDELTEEQRKQVRKDLIRNLLEEFKLREEELASRDNRIKQLILEIKKIEELK